MSPRRVLAKLFRALLASAVGTAFGRGILARLGREISRSLSAPKGAEDAVPGETTLVRASSAARDRWHTTEPAQPYVQPGRPLLQRVNGVCWIEDWDNPALAGAMRRQLPYYVDAHPGFPRGFEHRKHWEYAQVVVGLEQLEAARQDAVVLGVGAGHEEPVYDLTARVRWLFATDIYGVGSFSSGEADARMLIDPDHFARCTYNRNRLVVEHMDALDLRFEDGTFDAVYSLSSIEHFGGLPRAIGALKEMARVLKPSGVAALTTECVVNGAPGHSRPGLELFTPDALRTLFSAVPSLTPVQEPDFSLSEKTRLLTPIPLSQAIEDSRRGHTDYPNILLELEGRVFTSICVFLRKDGDWSSARAPAGMTKTRRL